MAIAGCPGLKIISGDILIWGRDQHHHDQNLSTVLCKIEESSLKINLEKCLFSIPKIIFEVLQVMTFLKKALVLIKFITNLPPALKTLSELKSFLGMISFCQYYIPAYIVQTPSLNKGAKGDEIFQKWL